MAHTVACRSARLLSTRFKRSESSVISWTSSLTTRWAFCKEKKSREDVVGVAAAEQH